MSRSGYSEDCDNLELYRQSVYKAIHGKRGQAFLVDLANAMDAMTEKVLISGELVTDSGECCAIGTVCKARSIDVSHIDYEDPFTVAQAIGISKSMAAEIAYENDEGSYCDESPENRWNRMRKWVESNLDK